MHLSLVLLFAIFFAENNPKAKKCILGTGFEYKYEQRTVVYLTCLLFQAGFHCIYRFFLFRTILAIQLMCFVDTIRSESKILASTRIERRRYRRSITVFARNNFIE